MNASPALQQFLSETSAHGLSRLTGQRPLHVRLFWAVSFLVLLIIFSISLVWSIQRFEQRGSKTTVFTEHVEFVFPDLYVCSMNPISGSFSLQLSSNESRAINASINDILGKLPGEFLSTMLTPTSFLYVMNTLSFKTMADLLGHRVSQMIFSSGLTENNFKMITSQNNLNVTEFYHPEYLRCSKISLSDEDRKSLAQTGQGIRLVMTVDEFMPEFPIDPHQLNFQLDVSPPYKPIPLYPSMWNFVDGWNLHGKSGLRLFLVEPNTFPDPWSTNVLLKAGTSTEVKISMQQIEVDEREFGDSCVPKSRVNEVEFHNPYSTDEPYKFKYSYAYCYYKELTRQSKRLLNCTVWSFPKPASFASLSSCFNVSQLLSSNKTVERDNYDPEKYFTAGKRAAELAVRACSNRRACSRSSYSFQKSSIVWPSESSFKFFLMAGLPYDQYNEMKLQYTAPILNLIANSTTNAVLGLPNSSWSAAQKLLSKQVLQVLLYGEGKNSTLVQVTLDYTLLNLFAETGGFLGLYLGCSVLTLAELLELLHNLIHLIVCKRLARMKIESSKTPTTAEMTPPDTNN